MIAAQRTWNATGSDDTKLLSRLPEPLSALVADSGGFILEDGAIHFRGCASTPPRNSLREAWFGDQAFHFLYSEVGESDVPFAQDQVGDQYLLRGDAVVHLDAETGKVGSFAVDLESFVAGISNDISEYLNVGLQYRIEPGFLLHAHPPFCTAESAQGSSLRPVPAVERITFHADLARQMRDLPDGSRIDFTFTP